MLEMTRKATSAEEGRRRVAGSLDDGTALEKFKQMLIRQCVDERTANELCYGDAAAVLPTAKYRVELRSPRSGRYVSPPRPTDPTEKYLHRDIEHVGVSPLETGREGRGN